MINITKKIEFDAGHRVIGHANKCKYLHGHRYVLEVTVCSAELDDLGMVMDFGTLKEAIKHWIDTHWDHNLILHEDDAEFGELVAQKTGQKIYYLPSNPTAENLALYLRDKILPDLLRDFPLQGLKVKLFETPNSFVEV
jgi:6-pyruvoyltetrahydropterin/6-carboxytetrahydropterin synthase